jgi:lipopolysaccharide biosynthesis protein
MSLEARAVAFYLPQYFPIPENDRWWGPGFTEWTNTAKARPLFPGHRQPNLPSELGFYDLRVPETRERQSDLALAHGIEAFAYWHYWFGDGDRILERQVDEVIASGEPKISFCLAWANQSWTGIWHGAADRVLKEQRYPGPSDDKRHFDTLLDAFRDERYLRVDGRPVFYVYRPTELPDAAAFVDRWQHMARAAALPGLYLVAEVEHGLGHNPLYTRAAEDGFDASVYVRFPTTRSVFVRLRQRIIDRTLQGPAVSPYSDSIMSMSCTGPTVQPCVMPNWDNTPRSGRRGLVLTGATPAKFSRNVRDAVATLEGRPPGERLLWIKSWNEWAEGNYLEPDSRHGRGWLEALRDGLTGG